MHVYPTDELRREHELVLMVVEAMEREAEAISRSATVNRVRVAQMVDFARNFTDGCHHRKEEEVLFPAVRERSKAAEQPVAVLLSEHLAGRTAMKAVDAALLDADVDSRDRAVVAEQLELYAALLRRHIAKEDALLFPLSDKVLSDQEQELMAREFERIEEQETGPGEHRRYHTLARELARTGPPSEESSELAA